MGQATVNLIVIEPSGPDVVVNFIGNGWEGQWHRRCRNLNDALTAIREELAPHPDNVRSLGTKRESV